MEALYGAISVEVTPHGLHYAVVACNRIKPISHTCVLYWAITMYWHQFLDWYLYSLSKYDSNKTLKVRCQYIVIAQYKKNLCLMGLTPWQLHHIIVHAQRNTYTGPDDVIRCAKPKVYVTMAENQTKFTLHPSQRWQPITTFTPMHFPLDDPSSPPPITCHQKFTLFLSHQHTLLSQFIPDCHTSPLPAHTSEWLGETKRQVR